MRREIGFTSAPSKLRIGTVIPPEGKRETTGVLFPGTSNIITIYEPATLKVEYATLRRWLGFYNNNIIVNGSDICFYFNYVQNYLMQTMGVFSFKKLLLVVFFD